MPLVVDIARFSSRRGFPHYANYLYGLAVSYVTSLPDEVGWNEVVFVIEELAHSFLELRAADRAAPLFRSLVQFVESHGRLD